MRPRPLLTAIAGTAAVTGLFAIPAIAQEGRPSLSPTAAAVDTDTTTTASTDALPTLATTAAAGVDGVVVATPRPLPTDRPDREVLRLKCAGRLADSGRAAIHCAWTPTEQRRAAGYVLERRSGDSDPIVTVATRDLGETEFVDTEVRLDVAYGYRVRVVDPDGRTIGGSGWVRAHVESPDPAAEPLAMKCGGRVATTDQGRVKVASCTWRASTNRSARGYQLWMAVDGQGRELVYSGGLDALEATTRVPLDAAKATFVVLALDGNGSIVGESRPQTVTFPTVDRHDDRPVVDARADARLEAARIANARGQASIAAAD